MKKILIFTSSFGSGHKIAAGNIKEGLTAVSGKKHNVKIVDFINSVSKIIGKTTEKAHMTYTKYAPTIFKYIYKTSDKEWKIKLFNYLNYPLIIQNTKKLLRKEKPDIIISTHPLWDFIIKKANEKTDKNAKFISVVTDSILVHRAWITANPDYHIVPNIDTAKSLKKLGVQEKKIKVLGFPVSLNFKQKSQKTEMYKKLNFDKNIKTGLMVLNSAVINGNLEIIKKIAKSNLNIQLMIITGENKKIREEISKIKSNIKIKTFGWIKNMAPYIKSCDFVITKAGGAIVMECIAAKKPLIITQVIPGQEEGNVMLIKKYKLGLIINRFPSFQIKGAIKKIIYKSDFYCKNLSKLSNPNASIKIAKFIEKLL